MKTPALPRAFEPTMARKGLMLAERLRYRWEYRGRLRTLLRQVDPKGTVRLTSAERRLIREYWAGHGIAYVSSSWFRLFKALIGRVDPRYIPEEVFRVQLEPMLCRRDVAPAYHDKNEMDRLFPDIERPATVLRNIYGHYFDAEYRPLSPAAVGELLGASPGPCILKPSISGTGSGHNVARVDGSREGFRIGGTLLSLADVERIYVQDFIVQRVVPQHSFMARFHPPSLNTIRVITLRLRGVVRAVAATFRMGNGNHIDNGHAGGLLCGVDLDHARLTPFACDVLFRRYDRHPVTGEVFADRVMPGFDAIRDLAAGVHSRLAYFDVLSCDIALLENGRPCLIEANTFGQGVEPHQFLKGAPLFGDDTDEVLALIAGRAQRGWNR